MIGKVKYIGDSFRTVSLTNGKIYTCLEVDYPFLRIIDDSGEDYLYSIKKPCSMENPELCGEWIIIEDYKQILQRYIYKNVFIEILRQRFVCNE